MKEIKKLERKFFDELDEVIRDTVDTNVLYEVMEQTVVHISNSIGSQVAESIGNSVRNSISNSTL